MKKTISALVVVLFLALIWSFNHKIASAELSYTDDYGTWYYNVDYSSGGSIELTGFTSSDYSQYIYVPSKIGNFNVIKIEENVFKGKIDIISVNMPDTILTIGDNAFKNCVNLSSVKIPALLGEIPYRAFSGCSNLVSVNGMGSNTVMKKIGYEAFYSCTRLESITIPNSVYDIEARAFYNCGKLKSLCFPTQIKTIDSLSGEYSSYELFMGCGNLEYVFIPSGVTEINDKAFDRSGFGYYVPKIYGMNGSYARTYANEKGIEFSPLDSVYSGIKYDISVSKGFIIRDGGNGALLSEVTEASQGSVFNIVNDANMVIPGTRFVYWKRQIEINAVHNSLTYYPYNNTDDFKAKQFTVNTPEEAASLLMDYVIKNESSTGYYKLSGKITFTPVYKPDTLYSVTVTNGTSDKESAREDEEVTVTAEEITGKEFSYWEYTGIDGLLPGRFNPTLTFVMPGNDVTFKANYTNRDKHGVDVVIKDQLAASDESLATVTLDKTSAYYNETITGSITLNPAAGSCSIKKDACNANDVALNWIDDTHFSFKMPDKRAYLDIVINVFRTYTKENNDKQYILVDMKNVSREFEFTDDLRYNCFLEIINYLKSQGKADYNFDGSLMKVDIDGDGSDDFAIDTSKKVHWLETNSIAPEWKYEMDDAAVNTIREALLAIDQWVLYKDLEIYSPGVASDIGKQTIDMGSGTYKLDEDRDYSFMMLLTAKMFQGSLKTELTSDNKTVLIDLDMDGNYDLSTDYNTEDSFIVLDTTNIHGVYSLSVSDKEREYLKAQNEKEDNKTYYSAFDIIFPEKKDPNIKPDNTTPTPLPSQNGKDPSKDGISSNNAAKLNNTLAVKAKRITIRLKKFKKKKLTIKTKKAFKISGAQGKVSFKKFKGNKKITVKKNGKIVVKKRLKKGKYKVKVKVTAAGDDKYEAAVKKVTVKVVVK